MNVPEVGSEWIGRRSGGRYRVSRVPAPDGHDPGPQHCMADRVTIQEIGEDPPHGLLSPEMGVDLRTFHEHYRTANPPPKAPLPPAEFRPGAVVRLRSGGPKMTLLCRDDKTAEPWWQVAYVPDWGWAGKISLALLPQHALELVPEAEATERPPD